MSQNTTPVPSPVRFAMSAKRNADSRAKASSDDREAEVRIIGGHFRGRRLNYHGDPTVRPMKHRTREAIFDLVSTGCKGRHAIDLFAGTGALGLEAISRGATSATFIEKHVPTARVVEANIRLLELENQTEIAITSAFLWAKRDLPPFAAKADKPWLVFCSPPYAFYTQREAEMLDLISRIREAAPPDSILIVEAEVPFDFTVLPGEWDVRTYNPAAVGIWHNI
jgi:16S rRNA (guanine966-N2)-methyltransferase